MKTLALSFVTLIALSSSAFACAPQEAEMIGKVQAIRKVGLICQIKVGDFSLYQESGVCPLDEGEQAGEWIITTDCKKQIGDDVSGYLSKDIHGVIKL